MGIPRGRSGTRHRCRGSRIRRRRPKFRCDARNRGIWGRTEESRGRTASSTRSSPRPSRRTAENRSPPRRNAPSYRCNAFDGIRCSVCDVGIESTVIGIDCEKQQVCRWIRALIRCRSCCFGAEACLNMQFCRVCRRMEWRGVCGSP